MFKKGFIDQCRIHGLQDSQIAQLIKIAQDPTWSDKIQRVAPLALLGGLAGGTYGRATNTQDLLPEILAGTAAGVTLPVGSYMQNLVEGDGKSNSPTMDAVKRILGAVALATPSVGAYFGTKKLMDMLTPEKPKAKQPMFGGI